MCFEAKSKGVLGPIGVLSRKAKMCLMCFEAKMDFICERKILHAENCRMQVLKENSKVYLMQGKFCKVYFASRDISEMYFEVVNFKRS